ncbi:Yip1-like protein [Humitalea rosea]|uniref:Yip1-like protein n=1 Tax=Humitalea rosea TaxID=990373 RepID=A0A2W7J5N7_9PROT|nr:Yip1 family protein [Humitalea rosea]PZW47060.1 Yip1-like protein [Humitalea rosea]
MDIVARAKNLILSPRTEWAVIAAEPVANPIDLIKSYAVPLSLIPAICSFIGSALIGAFLFRNMGPGMHFGLGGLLVSAVVGYVLGLVGVFIIAKIIEMLQPSFGAPADPVAAMKIAVYSPTAMWLAGIFTLLPPISFLAIFGLYSIYLLYVGVPIVGRVPEAKAVPFILVLALIGIVVNLVIGALLGMLFFMF